MEEAIISLMGKYGWAFLAGFIMLMFRKTIESAVDGFMVFVGNDYNEDDVITLDGKPGRIIRVGLWKTVFFVYNVKEVKGTLTIAGGSKLVIQNSSLKSHVIAKPLPELDLSEL